MIFFFFTFFSSVIPFYPRSVPACVCVTYRESERERNKTKATGNSISFASASPHYSALPFALAKNLWRRFDDEFLVLTMDENT